RIGKYVRFTQDVLKEIISAGHLLPRLFAGGDDFLQVILSKANILADPSIRDRVPPGPLVEPTDRNSEDFGRFLDGEQPHRVIGGGGHWHWFILLRRSDAQHRSVASNAKGTKNDEPAAIRSHHHVQGTDNSAARP